MKGSQAMARKRPVLGNDPFQRGAAVRPEAEAARKKTEPAKRGAAPEPKKGGRKRAAKQPAAEQAVAKQAVATEPVAEKPAAKKPAAKKPAAKRPAAKRPATKKTRTAAPPELAAPPPAEAAERSTRSTARPADLLPADAGAEERRPAVVAVEPIAPAPDHERPLRIHPTALDALEAAATAVAGVLRLPGSPTALGVDEFGRDPGFEEQVRPLLEWIYERWFRVVAHGFDALPRDVPLVLVANRAGALPWDSLILSLAARRAGLEVRPLVEDSIFHFPSMGLLINRLGAVRACPENAERILGDGGAVAVFPEGATGFGKPYRERYRLQRFGRGGFLRLALRMEALVVPVSIVGSEEIYPLLGKVGVRPFGFPFLPITPTFPWLGLAGLLPLPSRWHIDVGEPFDFRAYGTQAAQDEPLVMRLAEEVRGTVQHLLDARLGQRRSVFR